MAPSQASELGPNLEESGMLLGWKVLDGYPIVPHDLFADSLTYVGKQHHEASG